MSKKTMVHQLPTPKETLELLTSQVNAESLKESLKEMYNGYLKSEDSNDVLARSRVLNHYDWLDGLLETLVMVSHFDNKNV